ncbi:RNA-binding protein NOB1 [Panulirus ornatus]|uniref:RNA-binding protein NOB1 n=1 Tax=Panulirus ornatus TaxID=150431 RepID=UPI003A88E7AF
MKCSYLVVDTAAFVKNVPIWEYGEKMYSLQEVIEEIRDKQTRERLEAMPVPITMRDPQPHSIRFVNEFSKKTGDYASLSLADVKLLALTYELEVETRGGSEHLQSEPRKIITEGPALKASKSGTPDLEGFYKPSTKCEDCEVFPSSNTVTSSSFHDTAMNHSTLYFPKDLNIYWRHLMGLNSFLEECSYINGFMPTSNDFLLYAALVKKYPQFSSFEDVSDSGSSEDLETSFENRVCPLLSTFPHIKRWASHISSFTEEERTLFPNSTQPLEELLHDFGERIQQMEDVESPQTDVVEPESVDLGNLSLSERLQDANHDENDDNSKEEIGGIDPLEKDEESDEEESNVDDNTSEDESDGEGWITPSNLKQQKLKNNFFASEEEHELPEDVQVACITADFSIQNVLMHIGLPVMGVDGKLIRHIKTFILRCHACFRTTSIMTKVFCPHCGNKTLKKVSVTVNPDGTQKIWINTKKPISKRGTKYSLPAPKGGKHGRNPILVADQREAKRFSSKMSRKKVNPLHEGYDPDYMPFAVRDVYSRAAQLGYIGGRNYHHYYWEKKNPNEPQKRMGKIKKKW